MKRILSILALVVLSAMLVSCSDATERAATKPETSAPTTEAYSATDYSTRVEEKETIVYVTETGTKYHCAGCQYLKDSSFEISLDEAKAKGYTRCSKCQPPR